MEAPMLELLALTSPILLIALGVEHNKVKRLVDVVVDFAKYRRYFPA
jgi:hypothetical protein